MEQIQESVRQPVSNNTCLFKSPLYLRFMVMLVVGFSLTNFVVMVVAQSTRTIRARPNPFLEYADLFPGNQLNSAHVKSYSCWGNNTYQGVSEVTCRFIPTSDIFSDVEIILANGTVRKTTFTLRDSVMKIGDLVFLLDAPNFRTYPRKVFFFWHKLFVIVSTTARGYPSAIRPVWSVTFTNVY